MSSNSEIKEYIEHSLNGFVSKDNYSYTPHFCEENIWMMLKKIEQTCPEKLECCYSVFISNENTCVPLWKQKVSKQEDGFVIWDYHVILVCCSGEKSWVFDFDTQLPFPTSFIKYCKETFKSDKFLNPLYHRFFRVIPGETYLKYFSSDRRHMKSADGSWMKPPPSYSPIKSCEENHSLPKYISMKEESNIEKFGSVFNLESFINKFSLKRRSNLNYMYPPEPVRSNFLE